MSNEQNDLLNNGVVLPIIKQNLNHLTPANYKSLKGNSLAFAISRTGQSIFLNSILLRG